MSQTTRADRVKETLTAWVKESNPDPFYTELATIAVRLDRAESLARQVRDARAKMAGHRIVYTMALEAYSRSAKAEDLTQSVRASECVMDEAQKANDLVDELLEILAGGKVG